MSKRQLEDVFLKEIDLCTQIESAQLARKQFT